MYIVLSQSLQGHSLPHYEQELSLHNCVPLGLCVLEVGAKGSSNQLPGLVLGCDLVHTPAMSGRGPRVTQHWMNKQAEGTEGPDSSQGPLSSRLKTH